MAGSGGTGRHHHHRCSGRRKVSTRRIRLFPVRSGRKTVPRQAYKRYRGQQPAGGAVLPVSGRPAAHGRVRFVRNACRGRTMRTLGLFLLVVAPAAGQPPATITPPAPAGAANPQAAAKPPEYPKVWPPGPSGRALPEWLKDLTDRDPAVREAAIKVIPVFGPEAVPLATRP